MENFKINGTYYELILEDGDLVVLSDINSGESLVLTIEELWGNYGN